LRFEDINVGDIVYYTRNWDKVYGRVCSKGGHPKAEEDFIDKERAIYCNKWTEYVDKVDSQIEEYDYGFMFPENLYLLQKGKPEKDEEYESLWI